jgi:hypothetical protein
MLNQQRDLLHILTEGHFDQGVVFVSSEYGCISGVRTSQNIIDIYGSLWLRCGRSCAYNMRIAMNDKNRVDGILLLRLHRVVHRRVGNSINAYYYHQQYLQI